MEEKRISKKGLNLTRTYVNISRKELPYLLS